MSAYKDTEKGTWYVKFRYKDWQGHPRATTKRGFRTKKEALAYEADFQEQAKSQFKLTVKQLYDIYIEHEKSHVKPSTVIIVKNMLSRHVVAPLGEMRLDTITPNIIRIWQNDLKSKELSPSTIKNINGYFSALLTFAVKYYNLPQNPFKITGSIGYSKKRTMFWTLEQFNKVIAAASQNPKEVKYALMLKILFFSGMRYGELMALTFDDFDFRNNTISIVKGFMQGARQTSTPKSKSRVIAMPALLMYDVRKYKSMLYDNESHPFAYKSEYFRKRLRAWSEKAGIPYIHIHSLRHSHITYLMHKNFPAPAIAYRVGDSVETILRVYVHATKEDEMKILADLSENVGQSVVKSKNNLL